MNFTKILKSLRAMEEYLSTVPRLGLLILAVFVLRLPASVGPAAGLGWYFRWPLDVLLLGLCSLALAAGLRLIQSHGNEGPVHPGVQPGAAPAGAVPAGAAPAGPGPGVSPAPPKP